MLATSNRKDIFVLSQTHTNAHNDTHTYVHTQIQQIQANTILGGHGSSVVELASG